MESKYESTMRQTEDLAFLNSPWHFIVLQDFGTLHSNLDRSTFEDFRVTLDGSLNPRDLTCDSIWTVDVGDILNTILKIYLIQN